MLLSLISVLVLLVIGFYALWIAASGRVSGPESPELHLAGRGLVAVLGLVALGAAFAIYRLPGTQAGWAAREPAPKPAPVASDTRSRSTAEAEAAMAQSVKDDAAAAETPAAPEKTPAAKDEEEGAISSTAALREEEVRLPRGKAVAAAETPAPRAEAAPVVAATPPPKPAPAAAPVAKTPIKTVTAPVAPVAKASSPSPAAAPRATKRREASGPLTLHVQNHLGRDQQYEQLTLSIEGLAVADFNVDTERPAVSVAVPLPRPGLLHYRLEGFADDRGARVLMGEGCIRVRDGARFTVRRRPGSDRVFLETARAG